MRSAVLTVFVTAVSAAFQPNLYFNYSIHPTSGYLHYTPSLADSRNGSGWHDITNTRLAFQLPMTSMAIRGSMSGAKYCQVNVSLSDGVPGSNPKFGVVPNPTACTDGETTFSWAWSKSGFYGVEGTVRGGGFEVYDITATLGVMAEAPSFELMPRRVERFADNGAKNPFFEYSTTYLTTTIPRNFTVLGESLMAPPEGQVTFEVPGHTSFLTLSAHFHPKASPEGLLVTMTPPPPLDTTSGSKAEREVSLYNDAFEFGATTAYVAVLDPNVQYGMGISTRPGAAGAKEAYELLEALTFYSALRDKAPSRGGSHSSALARRPSLAAIASASVLALTTVIEW